MLQDKELKKANTLSRYEKYKKKNSSILEKYELFKDSKKESVMSCARFLWLEKYQHKLNKEQLEKIRVYRCKDRFCPFCQWKKASKLGNLLNRALELVKDDGIKFRYIFLTLTVRNCLIQDLKTTFDDINKSFHRMSKTVRFKKSIEGFYKNFEFTVNPNDKTLNPHLHIILAVKPVYFNTSQKLYIKQSEWQLMWQKALKVSYLPICNVKIVKSKNLSKNLEKSAISELLKYTVKDTDLSKLTPKEFKEIHDQLKSKRFHSAGGLIKYYLSVAEAMPIQDIDLIDFSEYDFLERVMLEFNFKTTRYEITSSS